MINLRKRYLPSITLSALILHDDVFLASKQMYFAVNERKYLPFDDKSLIMNAT